MEVILGASELAVGVGRVPSLAVRLLSQRYVQSAATAASLLQVAAQLHGTRSLVERAGDELERHSREKLEKELEQQRSSHSAKQWPHSGERRRSPAPSSASPLSRTRTLRRQTTQQTLEEIAAAHGAPSVDDPNFLEKYEKTQADLTTTFEAAAAAPPPTGSLALRRAASHSQESSPSGSAASARPAAKEWRQTVRGSKRSGDIAASTELVPRLAENNRLVEAQVARQRAHAERKEAIWRRQQCTGAGAASRIAETPSLGHSSLRDESPLSSITGVGGWGGGRSSASSRSAASPLTGARTAQPRYVAHAAALVVRPRSLADRRLLPDSLSRPSSLTLRAPCRVRAQKRRAPPQHPLSLSPTGGDTGGAPHTPGLPATAAATVRGHR